jgi:translation initiation factor 1
MRYTIDAINCAQRKATAMPPRPPARLVYTSDPDDEPGQTPSAEPQPAFPSARQQTARVARDRKRRAGKTVTVISGLRHDPATLERLLKLLKQQCGAGGTVKDGELEIQGDHRERVAEALRALGYGVKLVGG